MSVIHSKSNHIIDKALTFFYPKAKQSDAFREFLNGMNFTAINFYSLSSMVMFQAYLMKYTLQIYSYVF